MPEKDQDRLNSARLEGGSELPMPMAAAIAAAHQALAAVKAARERADRAESACRTAHAALDSARFASAPRIMIDSEARTASDAVEACCHAAERAREMQVRAASGYSRYSADYCPANDAAKAARAAAKASDAVRRFAYTDGDRLLRAIAAMTDAEEAAGLAAKDLADAVGRAADAARVVAEAVDASDNAAADARVEMLRTGDEALDRAEDSVSLAVRSAGEAEAADLADDWGDTCAASDAARGAAKQAEAVLRPVLGAAEEFVRRWEREAKTHYRRLGRPLPLGPLSEYAGAGEGVTAVRAMASRIKGVFARADEAVRRATSAADRVTRRWNDRDRAAEAARRWAAFRAEPARWEDDDSDEDGNNQFADVGGNYPSTTGNPSGGGRGND